MRWLDDIPRIALGHLPTPLEPLDRLSAALGGPRIWLKRDDGTGLATGGNKTRKLEYLLAPVANTAGSRPPAVLTFGAVQSNHARQTAAACAKLGFDCHLLLTRSVPSQHPGYERTGNPLLGQLCGAQLHIVDPAQARHAKRELCAQLEGQGFDVHVIPMGGSNAVGALGYVRCALELSQQIEQLGLTPSHFFHASSSAGTQSGLLYGLARLGRDQPVIGVNVSHADAQVLVDAIQAILTQLGADHGKVGEPDIHLDNGAFAPGYGLPNNDCVEAIALAAQLEGVLFDPVYSGKALAALIRWIREGRLQEATDVILLHTGGQASLAAYDDLLFATPS